MKITKPRVDSGIASKKTKRNRSHHLGDHRHFVSGGSDTCQLQDKLKACTASERELILSDLHEGGLTVAVPTSHALSMKADLNIPWSKLQVVRR